MVDAGYSLRAVCGEVIQLFAETARAKGISLQASFGDSPTAPSRGTLSGSSRFSLT